MSYLSLSHMQSRFAYAHNPLQHSDSIRLLQLFPGPLDAQLYGRLTQVRQRERATYEALSYVWGEHDVTQHLLLWVKTYGGTAEMASPLQISENLYGALKSLRLKNKMRFLWIDAICIDQENAAEKGHQVACMGRVFAEASCVVVWLGSLQKPRKPQDLEELEYLRDFAEWSEAPILPNEGRLDPALQKLLEDVDSLDPYARKDRSDSMYFFKRPWWRRLWIVQEFLLARHCELRIGNAIVDLTTLQKAVSLAKRLEEVVDEYLIFNDDRAAIDRFLRTVEPARYLLGSRFGTPNHAGLRDVAKKFHICDIIFEFSRSRLCSDERDRIYALLGLGQVLSRTQLSVMPDYNLTPAEVFENFTTTLLKDASLDILDECSMSRHKNDNTPSFVPHPTSHPQRVAHIRRGKGSGTRFYRSSATARFKAGRVFCVNVRIPVTGLLLGRGVAVDKVTDHGSMIRFSNVDVWSSLGRWDGWKQTLERCLYWLRHSYRVSKHSNPLSNQFTGRPTLTHSLCEMAPYDDQPFVHVFLRTISADAAGYQLDSTRGRSFEDYSFADDIQGILSASTYYLHNRVLFMTSQGYLGFGPESLQVDDQVAILDGAATPFVLRPHGYTDWKIVGPCYLHGWMYGDYFGHAIIDPFTEIDDASQKSGNNNRDQGRGKYDGTLWSHKHRPPGHSGYKALTKEVFAIR